MGTKYKALTEMKETLDKGEIKLDPERGDYPTLEMTLPIFMFTFSVSLECTYPILLRSVRFAGHPMTSLLNCNFD